MHTSQPRSSRSFALARRVSAFAFLACVSPFALHAQQSGAQDTAVQTDPAAGSYVADNSSHSLDLANHAGINYSSSASSSSLNGVDADAADYLDLSLASDATQPPPRRRYGRPRYNDSSHNPDGSNKYAFLFGVGLTLPTGNTYHYLNTDYAFQIGGGRNFNKHVAIMAQFDYDHFGFNGRTLYEQSELYDPVGQQGILGDLDGKSHVWSLTLDPTLNFYQSEGVGAYIVGGVGFYHKTANFTVPATGYEYYYGIPIQVQANETIDKYSSNAPGFDGGFGLTYKPSRFANERFYAEARYVFMLNSQRKGLTYANQNTTFGLTYTGYNYYPANSNRTTYIPIKVGIRF